MAEVRNLEEALESVGLDTDDETEDKACKTCGKPHFRAESCSLEPSPLLEYAGHLPEIWTNIIAHASRETMINLMQVSKAWFQEGARCHWYSPSSEALRFRFMPKDGFEDFDRIDFYAGLARHLQYTDQTDRNNPSQSYIRLKKTKAIPPLPNLRSLECKSSSLERRSVKQLHTIFTPGLRHVIIDNYVVQGYLQGLDPEIGDSAWFDIMTERCPLIKSIKLGRGLKITRNQFHHFVCRMNHLATVELEYGSEHLVIDHIRPTLKSLSVGSEWMNRSGSWNTLSQLHALEHLDIGLGQILMTSDQLCRLGRLKRLKHLHIRGTSCDVTAANLVVFIMSLPELEDFALWLEFDFFRHDPRVEAPGYQKRDWFPQFEGADGRRSYLKFLKKMAQTEMEEAGR